MLPKPKHLGAEHAAIFRDRGVAEAYPNRPPYPTEAIELLANLAVDPPRAVLDVGCGTGDIARPLVPLVERVDAVDFSAAMIERGRALPGGDHPHVRWIHSAVEAAPLAPPYALITAGESLHWLDWSVVFPRFVEALSPNGFLALVSRDWNQRPAMRERLRPIYAAYSTNRDYRPYDLVEELEARGLFARKGERRTTPAAWRPTPEEYVECVHSQNGFSRERMGTERAGEFDRLMLTALLDLARDGVIGVRGGRLELEVSARVVWGGPKWPW
jgi:SAM-dependent methyltransferase